MDRISTANVPAPVEVSEGDLVVELLLEIQSKTLEIAQLRAALKKVRQ